MVDKKTLTTYGDVQDSSQMENHTRHGQGTSHGHRRGCLPFAVVTFRGFKWLRYRRGSSVSPDPSSTDDGLHWIDRGPPCNRRAAKLDAGCHDSSVCIWKAAEAWASSQDPRKQQFDKVEAWLLKAASNRPYYQQELNQNDQLETTNTTPDARSKSASGSSSLSGALTEGPVGAQRKGQKLKKLKQVILLPDNYVVQGRSAA